MKKITFLWLLCMVCMGAMAQIAPSATQPGEGVPEHLYFMKNGNNNVPDGNTYPVKTTDQSFGQFAFYVATDQSGQKIENAYYIYSYTTKKWLTYVKAGSYENQEGFITMSDTRDDDDYFNFQPLTGTYEGFYQIAPYNTSGVAVKYLNWFHGIIGDNNTNTCFGLYQNNGNDDAGSRWKFFESISPSITQPGANQLPENLFTMKSGNNNYVGGNTYPSSGTGLFAFYAVENVVGAYYIYSHTAQKWLTYTKADNYENQKGFITMSDTKGDDDYFKVTALSGTNNGNLGYYDIQPYTNSGNDKYLNWFEGAGSNGNKTLGLWQQNGNDDPGSRWTFMSLANTVQDILTTINNATTDNPFPSRAEGVEDENITWPSEYTDGGFADFNFLTKAQKAVTENKQTDLLDYLNKLNTFISLSNQHGYPISLVLTYPAEGKYSTVYSPFNTAKPGDLNLYTCSEVNSSDNQLVMEPASSFKKNFSYIIKSTEGVAGKIHQFISYGNQKSHTQENATSPLKGTHNDIPAPVGSYVLQTLNNNQAFYLVADGKQPTVTAGKCYLQLPESAPTVTCVVFPDGTTTGIENILGDAQTENAPVYDLTGRRVNHAVKGVYIIGGKKVIVK